MVENSAPAEFPNVREAAQSAVVSLSELGRHITGIEDVSTHLSNIIDQINDIRKLEEGSINLQTQWVRANALVHRSLRQLRGKPRKMEADARVKFKTALV